MTDQQIFMLGMLVAFIIGGFTVWLFTPRDKTKIKSLELKLKAMTDARNAADTRAANAMQAQEDADEATRREYENAAAAENNCERLRENVIELGKKMDGMKAAHEARESDLLKDIDALKSDNKKLQAGYDDLRSKAPDEEAAARYIDGWSKYTRLKKHFAKGVWNKAVKAYNAEVDGGKYSKQKTPANKITLRK